MAGLILKFSFFKCKVLCLLDKNQTAQIALNAWDKTVAMAAPSTPILKPKIKTGSKIIFVTAPIITVNILILEKPCADINAFNPNVSCTKIVPTA